MHMVLIKWHEKKKRKKNAFTPFFLRNQPRYKIHKIILVLLLAFIEGMKLDGNQDDLS